MKLCHKHAKGWSIFAYGFSNFHKMQIRTYPPTHPSICTNSRRKYVIFTTDTLQPTHPNLHLVQIRKTVPKNGPPLNALIVKACANLSYFIFTQLEPFTPYSSQSMKAKLSVSLIWILFILSVARATVLTFSLCIICGIFARKGP